MSADQHRPRPDGPDAASPRAAVLSFWRRLWLPALLMALIVAGLWGPNLLRPPPPAWTVYNNVKGQIRRVVLSDKSVLRLNGASQVRVVYEDDDRRAALGQAEAAFTMTSSADRPFLISAGDRVIRTDGGEINILRQTSQNGAHTIVTVRRGQVRIYPEDRAAEGVNAAAGQEVSWTDGQEPTGLRQVNAANAFAWESHRLAYDKAPLSEVVADLNRQVARPIRIADPSLAGLLYTGVIDIEGEDMILRKLAAVLPIQAKPSAAEILLQKPTPKPPKKIGLVQSLLKLNKPKPQLHPLVRPTPRIPPLQPPQPKSSPPPAATTAPPKPQAALRQAKITS
ncbi:MAG: FecR family protein [Caulobacteraceae bacterium]